jgi:hypothetical protein
MVVVNGLVLLTVKAISVTKKLSMVFYQVYKYSRNENKTEKNTPTKQRIYLLTIFHHVNIFCIDKNMHRKH